MPSDNKPERGKSPRENSELDSALDQVSDESVAAAMKEFQDLLAEAKGDTRDLVRQNAEELERRLILLKNGEIDQEDFDFSWKIKSAISGCLSTASLRSHRNVLRN